MIDAKELSLDGSHIPEVKVKQSILSYLDDLNQELAFTTGFEEAAEPYSHQKIATGTTYPECGYINRGIKRGVRYLMETTVDCKYEIIIGYISSKWEKKPLGFVEAGTIAKAIGPVYWPYFQTLHPGYGDDRFYPHRHVDNAYLAKTSSANSQCGYTFSCSPH